MFELIPFDRPFHRAPAYDPFRELDDFIASQSKTVNAFRTDVIDNGDAFVLNAELPGFRKEDIKLDVENDCLTISAERKIEENETKTNFVKRERFYGSFSRSFDLTGIDTDKIEASYTDGVLSLVLPKEIEEIPAARTITIK